MKMPGVSCLHICAAGKSSSPGAFTKVNWPLSVRGCGADRSARSSWPWQRWRTLFSCTCWRRPLSRCAAGSYATSVIARAGACLECAPRSIACAVRSVACGNAIRPALRPWADHVAHQLWRPSPDACLGLGKTRSTLPRQNPASSTGPSQGCTTTVNSGGEAVCCQPPSAAFSDPLRSFSAPRLALSLSASGLRSPILMKSRGNPPQRAGFPLLPLFLKPILYKIRDDSWSEPCITFR
jgi:hypothetical protein